MHMPALLLIPEELPQGEHCQYQYQYQYQYILGRVVHHYKECHSHGLHVGVLFTFAAFRVLCPNLSPRRGFKVARIPGIFCVGSFFVP